MASYRARLAVGFQHSSVFFLAAAAYLALLPPLCSMMLATDAARAAVWWLTMGGSLVLLSRQHSGRMAGMAVLALALLFGLDMASQTVIRGFFGAKPQPAAIAEALGNTNTAEAIGFLMEQRWHIVKGLAFWAGLMWLAWKAHLRSANLPRRRWSTRLVAAILLLLGLTTLLHYNPSMLRSQPVLRWYVLQQRYEGGQEAIRQLSARREEIRQQLSSSNVLHDDAARTVVLIIGESSNRSNWGVYGYGRDTTKPLTDALRELPGRHGFFPGARSTEAFTMPSLKQALTPATKEKPELWDRSPDLFMLAKQAGYHLGWLSNQPKGEGWLAALASDAEEKVFINNGNWRDSSSHDLQLLDPLRQHLAQHRAKREFIVVHLLGQHFHFEQRCPANLHPYRGVDDDAVMREMVAAGRSADIRTQRNAYDDAVYCGAQTLSGILREVSQARSDRQVSVLYFSDHGQEVGHNRDFAGHSERDDSGYTIPMLLWQNSLAPDKLSELVTDGFQLDHLDELVLKLLAIRWPSQPA